MKAYSYSALILLIVLACLWEKKQPVKPGDLDVKILPGYASRGLSITNRSEQPVVVRKVTINGDYSPKHLWPTGGIYSPEPIELGEYRILSLDYGKALQTVVVETDRGPLTLHPEEDPGVNAAQ